MQSDGQSAQPTTIPEVLRSVEARAFWERVYLAMLANSDYGGTDDVKALADLALDHWKQRFEPKAGE